MKCPFHHIEMENRNSGFSYGGPSTTWDLGAANNLSRIEIEGNLAFRCQQCGHQWFLFTKRGTLYHWNSEKWEEVSQEPPNPKIIGGYRVRQK